MTAGHKNLYSDGILQNVIIPNASLSNINTPSMNYGYKIKYTFKN